MMTLGQSEFTINKNHSLVVQLFKALLIRQVGLDCHFVYI